MIDPLAEPPPPPIPPVQRSINTSVALLLSMAFVLAVFLPMWQPLLLATVLAASVSRWHEKLARAVGGRRYLSASLFTASVVLLILVPLSVLGVITVRQAMRGLSWVDDALRAGNLVRMLDSLPDGVAGRLRPLIEQIPTSFAALPSGSVEAGSWLAGTLQAVFATVSEIAFETGLMLIALFFLLADGNGLAAWVKSVSPLGRSRTQELFDEFRVVSRSLIGANLVTGAAQAAIATLGYVIVGAPSPLFFGTLTFLTSFIPSVGTAIVCVPLSGLLALSGRPWAGLFLAAWGLLLVGVVDNVLRPLLMRGDTDTHGALLFFSIIGGILSFGVAGLVVGPLSLALFLATMRFHGRDLRQEGLAPPAVRAPIASS